MYEWSRVKSTLNLFQELSTLRSSINLQLRSGVWCFGYMMMEGNWKEIHSNTLHTQDDDDAAEE